MVDIETLAYPIDAFDDAQRAYLLKPAVTPEEITEALLRLNLSPLTARIIAVGMLNPDTRHGKVFYEHPGGEASETEDGLVRLIPCTETEILSAFWSAVVHYPRIITFNGRAFDAPFLMLRSALLGVTPTRNLVPYRFSAVEHCDLLDQLTYYGVTRRFNLDFYCKAFGIPSPKEGSVTGLQLKSLVAEGRYREIAEYCLGDIKATAELFRRWETYLTFVRGE